jgi:hypothetical protein
VSYLGQLPKHSEESLHLVAATGATGHVKKKDAGTFVLAADANTERARWGTAREIRQDIGHFLEYGTLPPASGPRW